MKPLKLMFVFVLLWCSSEMIAQEGEKNAPKKSPTVGVMLRTFVDEGRKNWQGTGPRPLVTVVWYPVDAGAKLKTPDYGTPSDFKQYFVSYPLAEGAEISRHSKKYPLIVVSHGSTSSALSLEWFGCYLASRGYIVAAVNHHGDTPAEPGGPLPQGFGTQWERAKDLSLLIDKMLGDSFLGPHIDANRIGAAGHSAGGATVMELAGAIFSPDQIQNFCKANNDADLNCHLPPMVQQRLDKLLELEKTDPVVQDSVRRSKLPYNDPRVKAIFAMAPAIGIAHTDASLKAVRTPVAIVAGRADDITPLPTNAERFANLITTSTLTVLPENVGHATFGSLCTPAGINGPDWVHWVCHDEAGVDRAAVHQATGNLALEFFEKAFAGN